MSDDERWSPPVGPVDPDHPECAAVIAEVWMLLDGECTLKPATSCAITSKSAPHACATTAWRSG